MRPNRAATPGCPPGQKSLPREVVSNYNASLKKINKQAQMKTTIKISCIVVLLLLARISHAAENELTFGSDDQGHYAVYIMQKGDSLWKLVTDYTDRIEGQSYKETIDEIMVRNNISDPQKIRDGAKIKIPLRLLSPRFMPDNMLQKRQYLEKERDISRYTYPSKKKRLSNAVIILDAGHGGKDPGAMGLYGTIEDEIAYDIMCRIKRALEAETSARVVTTIKDKSRGYLVRNNDNFPLDKDEYIQTHPAFKITDHKKALYLRCHLVNYIYRQFMKKNIGHKNIVFISVHADELPKQLDGTMVYIPDALLSKGINPNGGRKYSKYREYKDQPRIELSYSKRIRAEKYSGKFAKAICASLKTRGFRLGTSTPIRTRISRRGHDFVPAVIKWNEVPAKILLEVANLKNKRDARSISDYKYRERYAHAVVDGIIDYFANINH
jgi:N-acetylmuramoyl-L-alanine amidase